MARLNDDLLNLVEVALDAPMTQAELAAVEIMALQTHLDDKEFHNLKQIKIRVLIAQRVNKLKETLACHSGSGEPSS